MNVEKGDDSLCNKAKKEKRGDGVHRKLKELFGDYVAIH